MTAAGLAAASVALSALAGWLLLRRRYAVVEVIGASMAPTLRPGDVLLVRRTRSGLRAGQIVALRSTEPMGPRWLVKRLAAVPGEPVPRPLRPRLTDELVPPGQLVVLGDNPAWSSDSRHYGYVAEQQVAGVVLRQMRVRRRTAGECPAVTTASGGEVSQHDEHDSHGQ